MRIAQGELSDVSRYIENHRHIRLEDKQAAYENYLRQVRRFRPVDGSLEMLEIGTGTGWFPLLCKKNGLRCTGMEISPQLVAYAHEFGAAYGIVPDIRVGNIEESPLEKDRYDVIFAMSVFEHVEHWRLGLQRIYDALRPGGLLVFESTNKFSFVSGEYSFPLYGWLPDGCRYALRKAMQGPDIMHNGIDFHQFRYPLLRRAMRNAGFRQVHDRLAITEPDRIGNPMKRAVTRLCVACRPLGLAVQTFMPTTNFVAIK